MPKNLRSSAILLSLAFTGAIAFTTSFAGTMATFAQGPQGPPPGPRHHGPNAEFETRMLTKRLGLTPDQSAKVEPILAAQEEQLKALHPQPGAQPATPPDFKAMHDQHKAIMDQTRQQLAGILTPDQLDQLDKMHEHRGPGGPGGPHGSRP